jgi:release factor glutamine methyltransferase
VATELFDRVERPRARAAWRDLARDVAHALTAARARDVDADVERDNGQHVDGDHADEKAQVGAEVRALLAHVSNEPWSRRWTQYAALPTSEQRQRVLALATERATGRPLAYVLGSAAFRELELHVDERVLVPRPETETVVQWALDLTRAHPGGIAVDIGTGSGAIALALATEGTFDHVIATDVSTDALAVAANNITRAAVTNVELRWGADVTPLPGVSARVVVANPPYIAFAERAALPREVRDFEPSVALFASRDGMARYDALLATAMPVLEPGGWCVLEIDSRRADATSALACAHGWRDVAVHPDLTGRPRTLLARRPFS